MIIFIVGQLASKEDMLELQKAFKVLDTNNDGMLSEAELADGYEHKYGGDAKKIAKQIFKRIDMDMSGYIDYSEFVVATINKKKLLTEVKLKQAFNLFDKDGGGSITPDEIKNILFPGQNFDDEVWEKVVAEVDEDGNGHIDFDEFSRMMRSMVTSKDPEAPDDG